jgi:hypothetical protein
MVDASRGKHDRVLDRDPGARAVRDDDESAEPEEVGATVRLGVETASNSLGSWPDQEPTELPAK